MSGNAPKSSQNTDNAGAIDAGGGDVDASPDKAAKAKLAKDKLAKDKLAKDKLAKALRENLYRRKAQARARTKSETPGKSETHNPHNQDDTSDGQNENGPHWVNEDNG